MTFMASPVVWARKFRPILWSVLRCPIVPQVLIRDTIICLDRLWLGMETTSEIFAVAHLHNNSQALKVQSIFSLYQHIEQCILYLRKGRLNIANDWLGLGQMNCCGSPPGNYRGIKVEFSLQDERGNLKLSFTGLANIRSSVIQSKPTVADL